ncbi:nuclease-related domain-containing protein [Bacillus sp. HMF5848]|uniref:nuclease-related domain-containing protein n=1 Tax=Bacillus sp. HMF5848 TaxID=2495421 RepID=UPI0021AD79BF|nr:nuclease-related domain-containing protein [Bacillus sp. HMF5848]
MKYRRKPVELECEEALLLFAPENKLSSLLASVKKRASGYKGEREFDYHLGLVDCNEFRIIQDVRLIHHSQVFQIDTMIFTPKFVAIIDVKNNGRVIDLDGERDQVYSDDEKLSNHIAQARRHKILLQRWLAERGFRDYPVEFFVVYSNPKVILQISPKYEKHFSRFLLIENFPFKFNELCDEYAKCAAFEGYVVAAKQVLAGHRPKQMDVLRTWGVTKEDLVYRGVQCSECNRFGMLRLKGMWQCPNCKHISKHAHEPMIRAYLIVVDEQISVSECCKVLGIGSRFTARRLLLHIGLISIGSGRGGTYKLPKR